MGTSIVPEPPIQGPGPSKLIWFRVPDPLSGFWLRLPPHTVTAGLGEGNLGNSCENLATEFLGPRKANLSIIVTYYMYTYPRELIYVCIYVFIYMYIPNGLKVPSSAAK